MSKEVRIYTSFSNSSDGSCSVRYLVVSIDLSTAHAKCQQEDPHNLKVQFHKTGKS